MESVYRPRPFDRFHRAGRQRTHCVRPPRHVTRHSPGRDNTDRPVTTRLPGCGNRQAVVARRASGLSQRSPTPTTRPLLAGLGGPDRGPPFVGRVMLPRGCAGAGSLLSARRLCSLVASPPLNRAYPVRPRSRRPGPIGFTRSSTTVSAYSPGVRGSARACSPATVRISPIGFRRSPPRSKTCGYDHAFSTVSLAGPVDAMFGKSTIDGLWPSTLEYSFDELGSIALPIGVCMFLAVCKLVPRDEVRPSDPDAAANSSLSMISWILCHPVRAI